MTSKRDRSNRSDHTAGSIRYVRVRGGGGYRHILEKIKMVTILFVTGCILLALETTVFSRISLSILGMGRAAPSLGILFCMAVGFLYDEQVGGGFGLCMGFLSSAADAGGGSGVMIFPLIFFLFGYVSGFAGRWKLARNLPSFLVFAIIGGGVECLVTILMEAVRGGGIPPLGWIRQGVLPIWILSVLFAPMVYGVVWMERKI